MVSGSSPYLVTRRIVEQTDKGREKTWGYLVKYRGKEQKATEEELIKLVEHKPNQVQIELEEKEKSKTSSDQIYYLTVIEGKPDKKDNIKKTLQPASKLKSLKPLKLSTANKFKEFKLPKQKLIAI